MKQKQANVKQIRQVAQEHFGYEELRPGQKEALQATLTGHDTLAVMPTGSGKSAIYQVAGLILSGSTVVVSPLIALQRDQIEALEAQQAGGAAVVNSTLRAAEREEALEGMEQQKLEFLFLAPEQFGNPEVMERLRASPPSLFVVDEAHCVSEWGHDFRPDYLRLGAVIEELGHPRILALTATASPLVRDEIVQCLGMRDPRVLVRGYDRPNIWLGVERFTDEHAKQRALLERVEESEKPGIVYAATKKHAEEVAAALAERGIPARFYHAGMRPAEREEVHQAFMADELEVIVATTAFGMGIDKPNVRFVFHHDIPGSLDAYYQEIGRAGRDGEPARAILFYRPEDLHIQRFFAGGGQVDTDQVEQVARLIQEHEEPITAKELKEEMGLSQSKLTTALSRLEDVGAIEIQVNGEVIPTDELLDASAAAQEAMESQERHHRFQQSRIAMMRGYAEVHDCRREYLLNYFGEPFDDPCYHCDNCDAGQTITEDEGDYPFPLNSRVTHESWGGGMVMRYEGDKLTVLFDNVGYKTLALDIVLESGLLQPEGSPSSE